MTDYLPATMFDRRAMRRSNLGRACSALRKRRKSVACKQCLHHHVSMHATIYGRGQMVIPARARKEAGIDSGDVVNVLPEGDGRLVLVRMERPKPKPGNKVRIIRRKGKHSLLSIRRKISRDEIFKALEQFPP
jgi:AbrB family looped-hinge helix DNA binding protein